MPSTSPVRRLPRAALAMGPDAAAAVLSPETLAALDAVCARGPHPVVTDFDSPAARAALADAEVLITGWGCPPVHAGV
ncbi:hydroxyacid dehydrogenase, partial [Streptomyces sp. SID3915]|nr:hydroxyacid dehydrogenase [Streptomyces sp. SID3915]